MPDPSATYTLFYDVVQPHLRAAQQLLAHEASAPDDSSRAVYQPAAATYFMAGIDKALSLALVLQYLVAPDKVTWKWLTQQAKGPQIPNVITCGRGFQRKCEKLASLGFVFEHFTELNSLRNAHVHECFVRFGYGECLRDLENQDFQLVFRSRPLSISWTGSFQSSFTSERLRLLAEHFVSRLTAFLEEQGLEERLQAICSALEALPDQPYQQSPDPELQSDALDFLNRTHLGEGLDLLLSRLPRTPAPRGP